MAEVEPDDSGLCRKAFSVLLLPSDYWYFDSEGELCFSLLLPENGEFCFNGFMLLCENDGLKLLL